MDGCTGSRQLHSGQERGDGALAVGSHVRRVPVSSTHPLVRIHPASGEKALVGEQGVYPLYHWLQAGEKRCDP